MYIIWILTSLPVDHLYHFLFTTFPHSSSLCLKSLYLNSVIVLSYQKFWMPPFPPFFLSEVMCCWFYLNKIFLFFLHLLVTKNVLYMFLVLYVFCFISLVGFNYVFGYVSYLFTRLFSDSIRLWYIFCCIGLLSTP
jgi:hypothetical protein